MRVWPILKATFKFSIFSVIFFAVLLFTIEFLTGYKDMMAKGIASYFYDATGKSARIETVTDMSFFPDIAVSFEDLNIQDTARLEVFDLSLPFFHYLFNRGTLERLSIENLYIEPGLFLPHPLLIREAGFKEHNDKELFQAEGLYKELPLTASVDVKSYDHGQGRKIYKLEKAQRFKMEMGDLSISVTSFDRNKTSSNIQNIRISDGDMIIKGDIEILNRDITKINGELKISDQDMIVDLYLEEGYLYGDIEINKLDIQDFRDATRLLKDFLSLFVMSDRVQTRTKINISIDSLLCDAEPNSSVKLELVGDPENSIFLRNPLLDNKGLSLFNALEPVSSDFINMHIVSQIDEDRRDPCINRLQDQ